MCTLFQSLISDSELNGVYGIIYTHTEREIRGSESLDRLALTETENEILYVYERESFFFLFFKFKKR